MSAREKLSVWARESTPFHRHGPLDGAFSDARAVTRRGRRVAQAGLRPERRKRVTNRVKTNGRFWAGHLRGLRRFPPSAGAAPSSGTMLFTILSMTPSLSIVGVAPSSRGEHVSK